MVVLVRLVKRDKLRFRTALRSWMPRRGATIIGRGCLQNPVMLHDVAVSWPLPGSWQFAQLQRGKSVPKSCIDCRGIPAHNRGSLVSYLSFGSLQLDPTFPRISSSLTGATGAAGSLYEIGCKWPLGTLKDLLSRDALTNSSILSVLLGKATPIPVSSAVCTHVIMMLSTRAGTGRLAREIWQVYVNDQSRWAPVRDTNQRCYLNILKHCFRLSCKNSASKPG